MNIKLICFCSLYIMTSCCFALTSPVNSTLTLRLINNSTETLTYTGVTHSNLGNSFVVIPQTILPGGAATIIGTTTPYVDLVANIRFRDTKKYNHLLHIVDPHMMDIKRPVFAINNQNLVSFVRPSSFTKNENEDMNSIAYPTATITIENGITPDKDHIIT